MSGSLRRRTLAVSCAVLALWASPLTAADKPSEESRMWMTVGDRRFAMTLADTPAAKAFAAQLPLTLDMPDLNANEKHVKLPRALPDNPSRPGTIRSGDVMLWGKDTLVVFYVTFESQYAYTRIGRLEDAGALKDVLGPGTVRISFSSTRP